MSIKPDKIAKIYLHLNPPTWLTIVEPFNFLWPAGNKESEFQPCV
jgi:hypothetical protein